MTRRETLLTAYTKIEEARALLCASSDVQAEMLCEELSAAVQLCDVLASE